MQIKWGHVGGSPSKTSLYLMVGDQRFLLSIYLYLYLYLSIYIYIERERERKRETKIWMIEKI